MPVEMDALWPLEWKTREEIIAVAKEQAIEKAVEMGAKVEKRKLSIQMLFHYPTSLKCFEGESENSWSIAGIKNGIIEKQ